MQFSGMFSRFYNLHSMWSETSINELPRKCKILVETSEKYFLAKPDADLITERGDHPDGLTEGLGHAGLG